MTSKAPAQLKRQLRPVSWDQLHCDARALALRLLEAGPFAGLIAVTRGGLVPAAVVARELDLHLIDTVCVSSYDWQSQQSLKLLKGVEHDGNGWLVVEDLVDTGKTLQLLRAMLPRAHFAAVYAKPPGPGGYLCYRSEPGDLDTLPLGFSGAVCAAADCRK